MIKKLIRLANRLDIHGFTKAADAVDIISKICVAEDENIDEDAIRDVERLMQGWDTDKTPEFPTMKSDSPYPHSQFPLDKADVWYTYAVKDYDGMKSLPDTIESQRRFESYFDDGLTSLPNMAALIAFPEGIDLLIEFEAGSFPMASRGHDEAGKFVSFEDVVGEISGKEVRQYGTLVTNEDFISYAKEHGFSAPGHI